MKTVVQKVTTWVNSHYTQKGKLLLISMVFSVLLSLDANNNNGYYIACLTLVFLSISHMLAYFYSTPLEIKRDSIKRFICGQKNSYYITIKNPTNKAIYNLKLIDEYQYTHPDDLSESKVFDFKKSDRFLPNKTHFVKGIVSCLPARSERKAKMSIIPEGRGIIDFRSHKALRPEPMDLCYNITKIKLNYSTLSEPRLLSIANLKKRIPKSDTFVSQSLTRKPTNSCVKTTFSVFSGNSVSSYH